MEAEIFTAQVTAEIPIPLAEPSGEDNVRLPAVLAARAGEARETRRARTALAILAVVLTIEVLALLRLEEGLHLVIYKERPERALIQQ